MKAIPGDTWFSGRGWGLRWDWGFPNLPNSLQIIIKRGLRLLFLLSRCNTILSHLWLWRQDQPSTYWNEKATHNSLTFFSTVCLERLLSTMDAISCLSAFTDLCFLPETSFDRQGARVWVRWSSRQNRQRRRRKLQRYDTLTNSQIWPNDIYFGDGSYSEWYAKSTSFQDKIILFLNILPIMVMIFVSGGAFEGGSSKETWTETEEDAQSWGEAGQVIFVPRSTSWSNYESELLIWMKPTEAGQEIFCFSELLAFQSNLSWLQ